MKTGKRIRTVLYGDQRLSNAELEILHTPAMQRLYGLKQLGLTDRVFIDASHARIHHVVGVLQQVEKLVSAIVSNLKRSSRTLHIGASGAPKDSRQTFSAGDLSKFVEGRRPVIRLVGLLHDLTHAPYGHTVEDEIRLVGTKHDEPARQADAFYRLLCQLVAWFAVEASGLQAKGFPTELKPFLSHGALAPLPHPSKVGEFARHLLSETHPAIVSVCWRLTRRELAELFAHLGCAMTALLHLEALHKAILEECDLPGENEPEFQQAIRIALTGTPFERLLRDFEFKANRDAFMLDIVGNTVCADLLDYAKRDSHFAGLRLDYDPDRIAENFTLVSLDASAYETSHAHNDGGSVEKERVPKGRSDPFAGWCLRTAISLVSHKYRTDVPSELMNLLNVRFYLYERAIYHPTKCAAGSMLGTALQLLGWRGPGTGDERPTLPAHLRFVGDEVFIHDIRCALEFILDWTKTVSDQTHIEGDAISRIANVAHVHNGLVPALLGLRVGQTAGQVREELSAAQLMFNRLGARRYFRPVFRALPSSTDARLQVGAETLADVFRRPDTRYEAERQIETQCQLPLGTVTIHCPTRTTARKIANVLLTKPGQDNVDEVCKLKDIGSLDGPIFGDHQKAVKAVEQMYGSMWRLTVYVAPEHLPKYAEIAKVAGQVIFKTIDAHDQFGDRPETSWKNDEHLERELADKLSPARGPGRSDEKPANLGELAALLSDQLLQSDIFENVFPDVLGSAEGVIPDLRGRIEKALLTALSPATVTPDVQSSEANPSQRVDRVISVFKTHTKKTRKQDFEDFRNRYLGPLDKLSEQAFDRTISQLQAAIAETQRLDQQAPTVHRGYKLNTLLEVLDELLREHAVSPPDPAKTHLFGG